MQSLKKKIKKVNKIETKHEILIQEDSKRLELDQNMLSQLFKEQFQFRFEYEDGENVVQIGEGFPLEALGFEDDTQI